MKKKIFFLWFFYLISFQCLSQQVFQLNTYASGPWWYSGTSRPVHGEMGSNYFFANFTGALNITKTTPTGFILWNMMLDDTNPTNNKFQFDNYHDDLIGVTVKQDTIYIIRFDSNGNELWNKHLVKNPNFTFRKFFMADNMNIIIAGSIGTLSISVMVCDSLGNFQYGKNYASSTPLAFRNMRLANDDGFIITGNNAATQCIIRTDAQGNVKWSHMYTTNNSSTFNLFDALEGNDGAIISVGRLDLSTTSSRPYVIKYDSSGTIVWVNYYLADQNTDEEDYLVKWSNGNICLATTMGNWPSQFRRMYFYMDGDGNALNQDRLANYPTLENAEVCATQDGGMLQSIFQHGSISTTVSFIKSHPIYAVCPAITPYPITPTVLNNYITISGNITASNYSFFNDNSQFSPIAHLTPFTINTVCGNTGVGLNENDELGAPSIVPNPASDFISVTNDDVNLLNIEIYDIHGKIIFSEFNTAAGEPVSISSLSSGIYFYVLIKDDETIGKGKLVVE